MKKKEIDEIDINILNTLAADASITNLALSKRIGLAPAPTLTRVRNLKEKGYIKQSLTEVDVKKFGYKLLSYQIIEIKKGFGTALRDIVRNMRTVTWLAELSQISFTGERNEKFVLMMYSKDSQQLRRQMEDAFEKIHFIHHIDTLMIQSESIHRLNITLSPSADTIA